MALVMFVAVLAYDVLSSVESIVGAVCSMTSSMLLPAIFFLRCEVWTQCTEMLSAWSYSVAVNIHKVDCVHESLPHSQCESQLPQIGLSSAAELSALSNSSLSSTSLPCHHKH